MNALAYRHLSATVTNSGVFGNPPTVLGVSYLDPTHLQLQLNASGADPNLPGEKYGVTVTNPDGQVIAASGVLEVDASVTAVTPLAEGFGIEAMIPNPTTGSTRIAFRVGAASPVRLSVLDVQGREIAVLADGVLVAGRHELQWNGRRGASPAPAGIYFVRYRSGSGQQVRRLAMMH